MTATTDIPIEGSEPLPSPQTIIRDKIDMYRAKRNAFVFAFIVAIGGFIFGLDLFLISGTHRFTTIEFGLTASHLGWIAASPGIGALMALLVAGYFCDRYGRKKTLLIIAALYTVSAVGSALATNFTGLFLFRLIGGLAFTSLSLASMYIGEIAPPKLRGKLVAMNQLNIAIGIFVASLLNWYFVEIAESAPGWAQAISLDIENVWRWMLGIETIPAVIWFFLLLLVPESPRWLILNGKAEQGEKVISRIYPNHKVKEQFNAIVESLKGASHTLSYNAQAKIILGKGMRVALLIGLFMAIIQPTTGMNALMAFMPMIFEQTGGGSAFEQTLYVNLIGMFFTLLALLLVDKLGRKLILVGGLAVCTLSMGLVAFEFFNATYIITADALAKLSEASDIAALQPLVGEMFSSDVEFKQAVLNAVGKERFDVIYAGISNTATQMNATLVLVGLVAFVCSYNFSVGPVLWILFSEIFPTKVRALAITGCAWITSLFGGFLVPYTFPIQLESLGAPMTFAIYGLFCLGGFLLMSTFLFETKGKTIEEIEKEIEHRSLKKA